MFEIKKMCTQLTTTFECLGSKTNFWLPPLELLSLICRYYGCGLVMPECLEGMNVLDLGSGAGQDCFVLSKLVGCHGSVTGVDMTDAQVCTQYLLQQIWLKLWWPPFVSIEPHCHQLV